MIDFYFGSTDDFSQIFVECVWCRFHVDLNSNHVDLEKCNLQLRHERYIMHFVKTSFSMVVQHM